MGSHEKKMHLVDMYSLLIFFKAKSWYHNGYWILCIIHACRSGRHVAKERESKKKRRMNRDQEKKSVECRVWYDVRRERIYIQMGNKKLELRRLYSMLLIIESKDKHLYMGLIRRVCYIVITTN